MKSLEFQRRNANKGYNINKMLKLYLILSINQAKLKLHTDRYRIKIEIIFKITWNNCKVCFTNIRAVSLWCIEQILLLQSFFRSLWYEMRDHFSASQLWYVSNVYATIYWVHLSSKKIVFSYIFRTVQPLSNLQSKHPASRQNIPCKTKLFVHSPGKSANLAICCEKTIKLELLS